MVEFKPQDREVQGLNPLSRWASHSLKNFGWVLMTRTMILGTNLDYVKKIGPSSIILGHPKIKMSDSVQKPFFLKTFKFKGVYKSHNTLI